MPFCGSAAVVPQFDPPWLPGIEIVSVKPGGVNMPFVARLRDALLHRLVLLRRRQPRVHVVHREGLPHERRRLGRERLRRPRLLAGHVALRHRPLFDRPQRLAGHAIEDIEEAGLARVRDGVDLPAVVPHGDELRRRDVVEVPEVVMDGLEVPQPLAGLRVEREQAVGEEVLADAGRRRRSRSSPSRSGCRRCRAPRRPTSSPSCWRRRRTCRRPSARSRSRTRPAAAPCGTATPSCR